MSYPIIDLFAGPGGLGEGYYSGSKINPIQVSYWLLTVVGCGMDVV